MFSKETSAFPFLVISVIHEKHFPFNPRIEIAQEEKSSRRVVWLGANDFPFRVHVRRRVCVGV